MKVPHSVVGRTQRSATPMGYLSDRAAAGIADLGQQLGAGIANIGAMLEERQKKTERFSAIRNFSEFATTQEQNLLEAQRQSAPDDANFLARVSADYDREESKFLSTLPGDLQEEFRAQAGGVRDRVLTNALDFQYKSQDAYYRKGIDAEYQRMLSGLDSNLGGDPANLEEYKAGLGTYIDASDLDLATKFELKQKTAIGLEAVVYRNAAQSIYEQRGAGPIAPLDAADSEKALAAREKLIAKGLPPAAAAAVVGNLMYTGTAPQGPARVENIDWNAVELYIRRAAVLRGIDPETAIAVANSEDLRTRAWQSTAQFNGARERSFGPFQLFMDGGLGNEFEREYGVSPEDPRTIYQGIDFALDQAAKNGWGAWNGAKRAGIAPKQGLENARPLGRVGTAMAPTGERRNNVIYANKGAIRNRPVVPRLENKLSDAVSAVYGDGYKVRVYSGGQAQKGEGNRTGSTRHDDLGHGGRAADVYIIDPQGKQLSGDDLAPLAQYWAARKYGGVGLEMAGGGIHLDDHETPPTGGGMSWNYGTLTPAQQAALDAGLAGQLPTLRGTGSYDPNAPADFNAEIDFILAELDDPESDFVADLQATTSIEDATKVVDKFMRNAGRNSRPQKQLARSVFAIGDDGLDRREDLSNLPYEDRIVLRRDAQQAANQRLVEQAAFEKEQYDSRLNTLFNGLNDGTLGPSAIDTARQSWLSDYDDINKAQGIIAEKEKQLKTLLSAQEKLSNGASVWSPTSDDDRKMLNALFDVRGTAALEQSDAGYVTNALVPMIARTRDIPTNAVGMLEAMTRSNDPVRTNFAYTTLAAIQDVAPEAFNARVGEELAGNVQYWRDRKGMMPEDQLHAQLKGGLAQDERQGRMVRRKEAQEALATKTKGVPHISELVNEFVGSQGGWISDPITSSVPWAATALERDFRVAFIDEYERRGNVEESAEAAKKKLAITWGTTEVGGRFQLMKYPPEKVGYKPINDSFDWISLQVREEAGVADNESFELVSDMQTQQEVLAMQKGGAAPSYMIARVSPDGTWRIAMDPENPSIPYRMNFEPPADVLEQQRLEFDRRNAEEDYMNFLNEGNWGTLLSPAPGVLVDQSKREEQQRLRGRVDELAPADQRSWRERIQDENRGMRGNYRLPKIGQ